MSGRVTSVGCDLVEASRIKALFEKQKDEFPVTILSEEELRRFRDSDDPVLFLAKHFAGKEAVYKTLRTKLEKGVGWQDVVLSFSHGQGWKVLLKGTAQQRAQEFGIFEIKLSMSQVGDQVMVSAIGEGN